MKKEKKKTTHVPVPFGRFHSERVRETKKAQRRRSIREARRLDVD